MLECGEFIRLEVIAKFIRSIKLDVECWPIDFADDYLFCYYCLLWIESMAEKYAIIRVPLVRTLIDHGLLKLVLSHDQFLLKGTRKSVNSILIKCGLFDPSIKHELGLLFGDYFFDLLRDQLSGGREPEHSLIHFTVQLFTVPSIISDLVKNKSFFSKLNSFSGTFLNQSSAAFKSVKKDFSLKVFNLLSTYRYIFNDPDLMNSGALQHSEVFMEFVLSVLSPFDRLNAQLREQSEHVLFESNSWTHCFNIYIQVSELCFTYVNSFRNPAQIMNLIGILSEKISPEPNSIGYSFHHPRIMILSYLIRKLCGLSSELAIFKDQLMHSLNISNIDALFRMALEPLIFWSEIDANLWIRNGRSMQAQVFLICCHMSFNHCRLVFSGLRRIAQPFSMPTFAS